MENSGNRPYRSLLWPILLIGVGVVWLLGNMGILPASNLNLLFSLWPLLLVLIGLDLLIGRTSPLLSGLLGIAAVVVVAGLLIAGPSLGIRAPGGEYRVENFTIPGEGISSAEFHINSSSEPVEIRGLSGSDALINASIGHYGVVRFDPGSGANRVVRLEKLPSTGMVFQFNPGFQDLKWNIGLSALVPSSLFIDSGSGSVAIDLSGVHLTGLEVDSGSGSVSATLPSSEEGYEVSVESGSGSVSMTLPGETDVTLRLDTGSGSARLQLPAGAAARLEVRDSGSGSLRVPASMRKIEGDANEDEGVWETEGFSSAAGQITIIIENQGSGSISIE